ncbi:MAG: MBL fold metallo-hydrolase [Pseudomonadota bacterium]|uniref:MBL fold metallo-hydrolase n=1 Tax=Alcanivorax sp. TaxID=1872427 RepID=UPI00243DD385|nr:MBL fold metallo-hydrolase [Alcanivorax sp.]MED5238170.1 MBL fold metallo-hydrolase [Pseudomonadota bacterium]MEE3320938.1 MBL fold metallo-hydrolase [Pseudomonadota bacterium]
MTFQQYHPLPFGITRIDTAMVHEELAACYLMEADGACAIIETGTHHTVPLILALLDEKGIDRRTVQYVIATHVHLDHAGGVGGLMAALPEATLLIHPRGARHMIDPSKLKAGATAVYGEAAFAELYGDIIPVDEHRVRIMDDGDAVMLADRELVFYDTPGHARHHFCVHDPLSKGLFTGDTFGLSYPSLVTDNGPFILPTTTPVQFDPPALKASIRKLLSLNPERMFLTHYGMLEDPEEPGQRLLAMVDDYVALAEQAASGDSEGLMARLELSLRDYLFGKARQHGVALSDEALEGVLGFDINLNSQGLKVWIEQRQS